MKEYRVEDGNVDIKQLESDLMKLDSYRSAHEGLVLPCHDIFVQYDGGILLVKRLNFPAKDILWPLGGRIKRGIDTEDSLREKVWEESKLELNDLTELGYARTYFKTDPFGHGKGTDTINFVYFGRGRGSVGLDNLHEKPTIILPKDYQSCRDNLHPYVKDFMDLAVPLIR
jgi:hypothetical protein